MNLERNVEQLIGEDVATCRALQGGKNSRAYYVLTAQGLEFAVKQYHLESDSWRRRLDVEYRACEVMFAYGLGRTPRPVARNDRMGMAAYSWVLGSPVDPQQMNYSLLDQFLDFISDLWVLRKSVPPVFLDTARDACIAPADLLVQISKRLERLSRVGMVGDNEILANFLRESFVPELRRRRVSFFSHCQAVGFDPHESLCDEFLTLSPSDFGLHNALVDSSGRVFFLDFEYFGLDDPAKMAVDFMLHPAMKLDSCMQSYFFEQASSIFASSGAFVQRVHLLWPLLGLKWATILLNEFLPVQLKRRVFAAGGRLGDDILLCQLAKAQAMLVLTSTSFKDRIAHVKQTTC